MKKFLHVLAALATAAVLAGCSSGVPLDNVPVEDRTANAVGTTGNTAAAGNTGTTANTGRTVAPVDLDAAARSALGPASARVVYFDYDSYVIKSDAQPIIENNAKFLKADSARKAVVEGHTDERGGREYNLALGQKRSEAVRRALGLLGVADAQVEAVSFGKEKPANPAHDEAALAANRRAEITYR